MEATPLRASVEDRETVAFDAYHPLLPCVPDTLELVVGGLESTKTVTVWVASTLPATSVAKYSSACTPSPIAKDPANVVHGPPSIRKEIPATPLVASVAVKLTITVEMYHPFAPGVPESAAVVCGAVVSIGIAAWWTASFSPALFVALKSRPWTPSPMTKNGDEYRVHAPPSTTTKEFVGSAFPATSVEPKLTLCDPTLLTVNVPL